MALSNHERVSKAMELLQQGLGPYVEREFQSAYKGNALAKAAAFVASDRLLAKRPIPAWDVAALLRVMWDSWRDVFERTLGRAEKTLVRELQDLRNDWAHQKAFSSDDAYRALDSAGRLLVAVSASQADEVEQLKMELLRVRFDEQARWEKKKAAGTVVESVAASTMKPWREVVSPHRDVASGRYQQAEFAADLWQVHLGQGSDEYKHPGEFFRRTYLTESLRRLLVGAAQRLSGAGGDPVIQLQTNFGGGKTHSMLALYHMASGTEPKEMPGVLEVLADAEVKGLPKVRRVVLVGNKLSPGNPVTKPDGTVVRTLWGELAWQLGGKKAFARVKADDEKATSPGDVLRELFDEYGPALVLVDEWVAYARQLHDQADLPAGTFETQFSFAQVLTESAKLAKGCLLVISLPASDTAGSPHTLADDAEVGGQRGREALDRLRNVVGRVEASWRPASAEEGFEIVRRRLFEPLTRQEQFVARDSVAREFFDLYRSQQQEFPPETKDPTYEKRLKDAYPIHPEVFDRLYNDWSTLVKFQRTRGVLRLMAAVIHRLWEGGDRNPLILPCNIPVEEPRVQFELTRYLSDNWVPVIEKDVAGPNSLPLRLDGEVPGLGKLHAARRVARTVYLGSAPTGTAANRGVEDRRIRLGCVMPGESPAVFGDALRRMAATATYLYQDGARYWYSTQPTVTKLAEDRAEQFLRDTDAVVREMDERLRADLRKMGDFGRVHPLPQSSQDVPDDRDTRLVVLGPEHPYTKEPGNPAERMAKEILEKRGNSPRFNRNTLVFLAVDKTRLQDLNESVRKHLAWESILRDKDALILTGHQVKQAETQRASADSTVTARLPEAYQWLLVPSQATKDAGVEWKALRLTGQEPLAVRASKKLKNDEMLVTVLGASILRMKLDGVPLWRGGHVSIRQLVEDFAQYLYLPRLSDSSVLLNAVREGLALISWEKDSFAYAESHDEAESRYRGLQYQQRVLVPDTEAPGLLVKPTVARVQVDAEAQAAASRGGTAAPTVGPGLPPGSTPGPTCPAGPTTPAAPQRPKRFHGSVPLDPARAGRDAGRIAEEVIAHLNGLPGAKVRVTLEIEAEVPGGAPDQVVRTVSENSKTLKFEAFGFENE
jgi:predicted AAA+ superfamily ATPase